METTAASRREEPTRRSLRRFALLLIVLATLALPIQALASSQVPFKGSDTGHFDLVQNVCGPNSSWHQVHITGTGTASQLGKYAYEATECFDGTLFYYGAFTMKAANGDTLVGNYSGTVGPTDDPNVATYDQDARVTGGTGRFAAARGTFHVSGLANLKTGDYSQKLAGTVSSPRAAKKCTK